MSKIDKIFDEFKTKVTLATLELSSNTLRDKDEKIATLINEKFYDYDSKSWSTCPIKQREFCAHCLSVTEQTINELDNGEGYGLDDITCNIAKIVRIYEAEREQLYIDYDIEYLYDMNDIFVIYNELNGNNNK